MGNRPPCPVCLTGVHHSRGYFPRFHMQCAEQAYVWSLYGFGTPIIAYKVVTRLAPTCYLCGEAPSRDAEHIVPRALGGLDEWGNLGAACSPCNSRKGAKLDAIDDAALMRLKKQQALYAASFERNRESATAAVLDIVRRALGCDALDGLSGLEPIEVDEAAELVVEAQMGIEVSLLDAQWEQAIDAEPPERDARKHAREIGTDVLCALYPRMERRAAGREVEYAVSCWAAWNDDDMRPLLGGAHAH